ncbi:MAG: hypothetical protein NT133_06135 [Alphaproteobacteria bacterium]|nr:hypothetical protein [Alphaproteobacteria bacterium]
MVFASASVARAGDAILTDHDIVPPPGVIVVAIAKSARFVGHAAACACCVRPDIARVLTAAYVARARSGRPHFKRVVVDMATDEWEAVRTAISLDAFVAGRYVAG